MKEEIRDLNDKLDKFIKGEAKVEDLDSNII